MLSQQSHQFTSACLSTQLLNTGMTLVLQHQTQTTWFITFPQLAGVALTPSLYTEMLKNPRVIGVKNSSMPVQDIQTFVSLGGDDRIVFNGPDEQFLGGRLMGAKAGIGGVPMVRCQNSSWNSMSWLLRKTWRQRVNCNTLSTQSLASSLLLMEICNGVIKEVLKINEGLNIGSVRSPLTPVTEEDRPSCRSWSCSLDSWNQGALPLIHKEVFMTHYVAIDIGWNQHQIWFDWPRRPTCWIAWNANRGA